MIRDVHYGVVVDNNDPDRRGGLKVRVDDLVDQLPLLDEFIPPSFPFAGSSVGWFFVPAVGAQVEVEVESDPERSVEDIHARWRSTLYSVNDPPPAEFTSDYPNRAGIKFGPVIVTLDQTQDLLAMVSSNVRLGEEAASHPVMRGDTYNQQLDAYLTAVNTLASTNVTEFTALAAASTGVLAPLASSFTNLATAWATFQSAIATFKGAESSWLSTKVKTE